MDLLDGLLLILIPVALGCAAIALVVLVSRRELGRRTGRSEREER